MTQYRNIEALSDNELLEAFSKEKDNRLLGMLLERYVRFVFVVCMKYLKNQDRAKEMSMQVFEKVSQDVCRFEIVNFKSWLHVVTKNCCLMQLRQQKNHKEIAVENENELERFVENAPFFHHEDTVEKEERLVELEKAIEVLEPEQKVCVDLFYLKGKSYKEVAEVTGYSMNQVKSHIQNGKRNLKNWLIANRHLVLALFFYLYYEMK